MVIFSSVSSNIELIKQGIDSNFGRALFKTFATLSYIVIALIYGWKLCLVILASVPLISTSAALMFVVTEKYKKSELKAYEHAGQIAHSTLSAVRVVYAYGLQNKFIKTYTDNLDQVKRMSSLKGFFYGFFRGAVDGLFISVLGVGMLFSIYLYQLDCESYKAANLLTTFYCAVQSYETLGPALAFLSNLSQGEPTDPCLEDVLFFLCFFGHSQGSHVEHQ